MKLRDTLTVLLGFMMVNSEVPAVRRTEICEKQLRFIVFLMSIIFIILFRLFSQYKTSIFYRKWIFHSVPFLTVMLLIHLSP